MKFTFSLLCVAILLATNGCHDKDPGPALCRPMVLAYTNDSIVYIYDGKNVKTVAYYESGRQTMEDEFTYSGNLLSTISKLTILFDGTQSLDSHHIISYDDQGLPESLKTDSYAGAFETKFTHENGRLVQAETTAGVSRTYFVGSTRYEYDDNGNVPKVYYTISVNGTKKEVLARENLSFDDKNKFYVDTPELRIANEYVYGYLPGNNNCLSSTVYYYSYAQHFTSPLSVSFNAAYNEQGLISTLQYIGTSTQLNSGEVLFNKASYRCN
ncbi:MAG: hypothetical protein WDO15_04770 [Bacteroidota bacterium]